MQRILHLDLLTEAGMYLEKNNIYKYAEDPDFKIQLLSYAYDDGRVHTVDVAHGEKVPSQVTCDIMDGNIIKMAHNAQYERICLSRVMLKPGEYFDPASWRCTQVVARYFNLPDNPEYLCPLLNIPENERPDDRTKWLIQRFGLTQNHPNGIPLDDNWEKYKRCSMMNVVSEQAIWHKFLGAILKPGLWYGDLFKEYILSEKINDRGVQVDTEFAQKMADSASEFKDIQTKNLELLCDQYALNYGKERVKDVTHGEQIIKLLELPTLELTELGDSFRSLPIEKQRIVLLYDIISQNDQQFKYLSMMNSVCNDQRLRGTFEFYGAGTGRFSGSLQNLKKNDIDNIEEVRTEYFVGSAPKTPHYLSDIGSLVRTTLVPKKGYLFSDADYSSIEARVLAWVAGEKWMLDAFAEGRDIYCETASQMYSILKNTAVKVEKDGENAELRKVGKVATLALGYNGGKGAFLRMGGEDLGLNDFQISKIVKTYREANPNVKKLWDLVDSSAKRLIQNNQDNTFISLYQEPMTPTDMVMRYRKSPFGDNTYQLEIVLPVTHRVLVYPDIQLETKNKTGYNGTYTTQEISFRGRGGNRVKLYGGKIVENIVQGIARDILVTALDKLHHAGYSVVMHIHDEILVEAKEDCTKQISEIMAQAAENYAGLPLRAEGFACEFFRKQ